MISSCGVVELGDGVLDFMAPEVRVAGLFELSGPRTFLRSRMLVKWGALAMSGALLVLIVDANDGIRIAVEIGGGAQNDDDS